VNEITVAEKCCWKHFLFCLVYGQHYLPGVILVYFLLTVFLFGYLFFYSLGSFLRILILLSRTNSGLQSLSALGNVHCLCLCDSLHPKIPFCFSPRIRLPLYGYYFSNQQQAAVVVFLMQQVPLRLSSMWQLLHSWTKVSCRSMFATISSSVKKCGGYLETLSVY
jgi:hypothetical protein